MFSPPVTAAIVLGAVIFSVYQYFKSSPNSHYKQQYPPQSFSSQDYSSPQCPNYKRQTEDYNCTICLETEKGKFLKLPCGHKFHHQCIRSWLLTTRSCPICRREV